MHPSLTQQEGDHLKHLADELLQNNSPFPSIPMTPSSVSPKNEQLTELTHAVQALTTEIENLKSHMLAMSEVVEASGQAIGTLYRMQVTDTKTPTADY